MRTVRWIAVALLVSLALTGCDAIPDDCERSCQKMKTCELLAGTLEECEQSCARNPLDCSAQMDCVRRSACPAVQGCLASYPCVYPDWEDDDW